MFESNRLRKIACMSEQVSLGVGGTDAGGYGAIDQCSASRCWARPEI